MHLLLREWSLAFWSASFQESVVESVRTVSRLTLAMLLRISETVPRQTSMASVARPSPVRLSSITEMLRQSKCLIRAAIAPWMRVRSAGLNSSTVGNRPGFTSPVSATALIKLEQRIDYSVFKQMNYWLKTWNEQRFDGTVCWFWSWSKGFIRNETIEVLEP